MAQTLWEARMEDEPEDLEAPEPEYWNDDYPTDEAASRAEDREYR